MLVKIQRKQSLLSSKVSSSHQIPSCQTKATGKLIENLNKYVNKLTTPYFNSFSQPFHIPVFYKIFDQRLLRCYENLFQPEHKIIIKIEK